MHLVIDGVAKVFTAEKADPIDFVYSLLVDLTEVIGMQSLTLPYVVRYAGGNGDGWEEGISGFTLISTSHIAIHTWFADGRFTLDIYSCKNFDSSLVYLWLVEALENPEKMETQIIRR